MLLKADIVWVAEYRAEHEIPDPGRSHFGKCSSPPSDTDHNPMMVMRIRTSTRSVRAAGW